MGPYHHLPTEPSSPSPQPPKITQPFRHDTWASAAALPDPTCYSVPPCSSRPQLPPPDLTSNSGYSEKDDTARYIERIVEQIKSYQAFNVARTYALNQQHQYRTHIQELLWNVRGEAAEIEKQNSVLKKVDLALTVVSIVSFVAALILTVATGGATLPVLLPAVEGVTSLGKAAVTGVEAHSAEKMNGLESQMVDLQADLRTSEKFGNALLKETGRAESQIVTTTKSARQLLNNSLGFYQ